MKISDFRSLIYEKEDKYVIDILNSTLDRKNNGLYKANGRVVDLNNDGQAEVVVIGLSNTTLPSG